MPRQAALIMTDSQRWDMLNCYRSTGLQTPNLDRLAAAGVRFERAYTCSPVCGPARAGLFTGTWPHSNGSWSNDMPLGKTSSTIGQRLQDAGIHAGHIGKWHLGAHDYFGRGICPEGWDEDAWYDMRNYLDELDEKDRLRSRRVETIQEGVAADFTFAHRCSNRAVDFLQAHTGEDFLLVVSYDEPHGPYICPREYYDMYRDFEFPLSPNVHDTLEDKPEHVRIWAGHRAGRDTTGMKLVRPEYFGCNTFVDMEIGRVLDAIDSHAPEALVLYTSDHGHMEQSHRLYIKGPAMYDEIARIPLLVRWPGNAPAGVVRRTPASHIDVTPTLLDFFGVAAHATLDGSSMIGALRDPVAETMEPVFCEFHRTEMSNDGFGAFQPIRCATDGTYKLVVNLLTSDEFYDLAADPYEMVNRIDDEDLAAERDRLHDRMLQWMNATRDPFRGWHWERRPWRRDARELRDWHYTGMIRQRAAEPGEPAVLDYDTGLVPEKYERPIPGVLENA